MPRPNHLILNPICTYLFFTGVSCSNLSFTMHARCTSWIIIPVSLLGLSTWSRMLPSRLLAFLLSSAFLRVLFFAGILWIKSDLDSQKRALTDVFSSCHWPCHSGCIFLLYHSRSSSLVSHAPTRFWMPPSFPHLVCPACVTCVFKKSAT